MRYFLALVVLALPAMARAQPLSGPYIGFAAGADTRPGDLVRAPRGDAPASAGGTGSGIATLGSAGYGLGHGVRIEVEGLHDSNRVRTTGPTP